MRNYYLFPGQFVVYDEPCLVTTILGSCVAIALFDPEKNLAALNHFLLPEPALQTSEKNLRYGSISCQQMLSSMLSAGASLERLQAKIFGGARVVDNLNLGESIGKQNIDFACEFLQSNKIRILERHIGGNVGRKIVLNTSDFSVSHQLMGGQSKIDVSGCDVSMISRIPSVVIVDDSAAVRAVFGRVLSQSGRVNVVGVARDAFEAREVIVDKKPDVILLDIEMPGMSGVSFLEKLMQHFPIPTIMVSSLNPMDDAAVRALELGALEFVHKPDQYDPQTLRFFAENLVQKVHAAASSPVRAKRTRTVDRPAARTLTPPVNRSVDGIQMILVGGNGGAHSELSTVLSTLPNDTPPLIVSVSTVSDHLGVFLEKWSTTSRLQLREAVDGVVPLRGNAYFAPAHKHIMLESKAGQSVIRLTDRPPVCLQRPSSDVLFDSALNVFAGARCQGVVSVLLGGFGTDGVQGLLKLREAGAHTIVAHPQECVFPFVPQSAIEAGAADEVLPPDEVAHSLMRQRSRAAV